jgi:hypothetical protein
MKKILIIALSVLPFVAYADHLDVIQFELKEGCSFSEYLEIKNDFNANWGNKYGYSADVLSPLQSHDLTSLYWIGRSADAASFGRAWDAWRNETADSDSVAGKLQARFAECSKNVGRRSYDIY